MFDTRPELLSSTTVSLQWQLNFYSMNSAAEDTPSRVSCLSTPFLYSSSCQLCELKAVAQAAWHILFSSIYITFVSPRCRCSYSAVVHSFPYPSNAARFMTTISQLYGHHPLWSIIWMAIHSSHAEEHDFWVAPNGRKFNFAGLWYELGLHSCCLSTRGVHSRILPSHILASQQVLSHVMSFVPLWRVNYCLFDNRGERAEKRSRKRMKDGHQYLF